MLMKYAPAHSLFAVVVYRYVIECESIQFKGLNTIKQHRLVSSILKEEVAAMHAVRIFTSVPEPEE